MIKCLEIPNTNGITLKAKRVVKLSPEIKKLLGLKIKPQKE
jgi:hypothetical protein